MYYANLYTMQLRIEDIQEGIVAYHSYTHSSSVDMNASVYKVEISHGQSYFVNLKCGHHISTFKFFIIEVNKILYFKYFQKIREKLFMASIHPALLPGSKNELYTPLENGDAYQSNWWKLMLMLALIGCLKDSIKL